MSILVPKNEAPGPPHFNEFGIRILTKVTMLVPKTGTSWAHFLGPEKPDPTSGPDRTFGPVWPEHFESIFGAVFGYQNLGPGEGSDSPQNPLNLTPFEAKSTTF